LSKLKLVGLTGRKLLFLVFSLQKVEILEQEVQQLAEAEQVHYLHHLALPREVHLKLPQKPVHLHQKPVP
jgi:hypothetical protein